METDVEVTGTEHQPEEPTTVSVEDDTDVESDGESDTEKWMRIAEDQRKRAERAEAALKGDGKPPQKKPITKAPSQPDTKTTNRLDSLEAAFELTGEGYTRDEAREIIEYASAKGISVAEAKEAPIIKAGIDALRAKARAESKTAIPANKGITINGVSAQSVLSNPDASPAERQAAFEKIRDSQLGRGNKSSE